MEFLLVNHPLDCPICDQGGECELQDVAMGYGRDVSRFNERKRAVEDKDLGPLIATDMTRCIHCTRCVRFGEEIGGMPELGATGRGEDMEIGTFITRSVDSELSGNVIDLCPVGALTSKPFRFRARAWEMAQRDGIAPHDPVGSNIHLHVRRGRVLRVVPRANESINEVWISDRDRFGYEGLYSDDRALSPMVKRDGVWCDASWEEALEVAVRGVRKIVAEKGGEAVGALASASCTVEELYLFQRLIRGIGSANVDHRVRQRDFSDQEAAPTYPSMGMGVDELERLDAALLIGSTTRKEHPIVNHRLRKASLAGASVMYLDVMAHDLNIAPAARIVVAPSELTRRLAAVALAAAQLTDKEPEGLAQLAAGVEVDADARIIARTLLDAGRGAILLGPQAIGRRDGAALRGLAACLADLTGATLGTLDEGANPAGAWLAGVIPHREAHGVPAARTGLDARAMLEAGLDAWVLMGLEPELDCAQGARAREALNRAQFVVSLGTHRSEAMSEYANVILPIAAFAETDGTFVNLSGTLAELRGRGAAVGGFAPGLAGAAGAGEPVRARGVRAGDDRRRQGAVRRAGAGRGARMAVAQHAAGAGGRGHRTHRTRADICHGRRGAPLQTSAGDQGRQVCGRDLESHHHRTSRSCRQRVGRGAAGWRFDRPQGRSGPSNSGRLCLFAGRTCRHGSA